jgi:hypothetical protein
VLLVPQARPKRVWAAVFTLDGLAYEDARGVRKFSLAGNHTGLSPFLVLIVAGRKDKKAEACFTQGFPWLGKQPGQRWRDWM